MSVVLDSSATLGWIFPDEARAETIAIFDRVAELGAWVPAIWRIEVANSFRTGIRRRRFTQALRDGAIRDLSAMDISIDPETNTHAWGATLQIADRFGLTLYDAAYIELAQRRALPLASLDRDMRAAAQALGLTVLG